MKKKIKLYIQIHIYTHIYIHMYRDTHIHIHIHTNRYTYTYTYKDTSMRSRGAEMRTRLYKRRVRVVRVPRRIRSGFVVVAMPLSG